MILPDENISFKDFSASLLTDFNTQDIIPIGAKEEDWKAWGNTLANSPTFVKAGVPPTDSFSNWREWGKLLYSRFG